MRTSLIAILLSILTGLAACSDTSDTSTEQPLTVIKNIKGYTFQGDSLTTFTAIAFENGKVVEVSSGSGSELEADTSGARTIDGGGKTMLPGLIDAHAHVMGLGYQEMNVNVAGIGSLDSTLQHVADYARQNTDLEWIRGRGWNHTRWPVNRFPTAEELDKVVSDRPVWLARVDGHAGWANSKALEMAGITSDSESPKGGKIIRDENGAPTGVFVDAAQSLIESQLPERSQQEQRQAFELALEKMRENGLTGVHDAGVSADAWQLYKAFADSDKLTTRIYGMIAGAGANFDSLSADGPIDSYADDKLALRSIKLYADGALGSRGAAMLQPYSDEAGNMGLLFNTQEEMNRQVMKAASEGYQVNVHAIGDAANRQALDAFEAAGDSLGEKQLRHRVEHAQIVALEDIPRFKELDVIASMQPTHATSDKNMAEDRVGAERMQGGYAWQTFLEQGTVVASGSDFPVEQVNPFYGLYSAISRQDHQGNPDGGWYPEQKMSRSEALRSFTIDAAYAAHQEDVLGTLEEGKWADFILVDRDLFEVPAADIWQTEVLQSWVAGEKVFDSNQ
jgi:predicted amidohydrolase YtcJ